MHVNTGSSTGAEDAHERRALLDRVLACLGGGAEQRWPAVARAAVALLGAEAPEAHDLGLDPDGAGWAGARWWAEDAESAAALAELDALARGALPC